MSVPLRPRREGGGSSAEGLTPPHSIEAEQSVLGALLIDSSAWDQAADVVTAADFYRPDHRIIFESLSELVAGSRPCDVVTVSEQLERRGRLEDVGGLAYLGTLARDTPTAANVRAYANIVRERALLRALIEAGREITASVFSDEGLEARELVDRAERRVFEIAEQGTRLGTGAVRVTALLPPLIDKIDEWHANPNKLRGLATGFTDFDNKTGGLRGGDLIIIAGRPSMGKTTLAVNIAEYAAINPESKASVAIFSMEMPSEQLVTRMLSSIGHVPLNSIRTGRISDDDWVRITSATSQLSEAKIFIDESAGLTPTELRARARRIKREHGLGLVVVDYLQLMQVPGTKENRATEIAEISRGLKQLAKELSVPVIALSQLNRAVEQRTEKKPVMSDLRECVAGDTLVCLANGRRVPIRELVGTAPEVWSMESGSIKAALADKVWHVGRKPLFQVQLASGRTVRATAEHRFFSGSGWRTVGELATGDRLAMARRVPAPAQCKRWPDHWLILLGHLVGDGSYLRHQPLRYTTASEANSETVRAAAEAFGSTVSRHAGPTGTWHQLVISGNGNRWSPAGVGKWLKDLGIFDQRSHEKHLPAEVFELPDDQIALLLRHLWATDGSVTMSRTNARAAPRVYFASCSRRLVGDVAALLMRIGIVARIRAVHSAKARCYYSVDVSGSAAQREFATLVGGHGPRVAAVAQLLDRLAVIDANTNVDTLPQEAFVAVRAAMQARGVTTRAMAALRGTSYGGASHFAFAPSRAMILSYADLLAAPALAEWGTSDLFWDRVTAVIPDGEDDVYDLTVPGPANWLADGVVTHNSGSIEQDADMILLIYRDEVYDKNTTKKGIAEIDLAKHRNGEIGGFLLTFQGQYTRFVNYAPDTYAEGILR
jgi:replicative DNA helicase